MFQYPDLGYLKAEFNLYTPAGRERAQPGRFGRGPGSAHWALRLPRLRTPLSPQHLSADCGASPLSPPHSHTGETTLIRMLIRDPGDAHILHPRVSATRSPRCAEPRILTVARYMGKHDNTRHALCWQLSDSRECEDRRTSQRTDARTSTPWPRATWPAHVNLIRSTRQQCGAHTSTLVPHEAFLDSPLSRAPWRIRRIQLSHLDFHFLCVIMRDLARLLPLSTLGRILPPCCHAQRHPLRQCTRRGNGCTCVGRGQHHGRCR